MRRILLRLVMAAVMVATLLVMVVPAFAAQPLSAGGSGGCDEFGFCGGSGGMSTQPIGDYPCGPRGDFTCDFTQSSSGGGGGRYADGSTTGGGGRSTEEANNVDQTTDPQSGEYIWSDQGGNSNVGGGNCTTTLDYGTGTYGPEGAGPRCDTL